eukprot:scaffold302427_cov24-Tisochrysis_lutea.AAC.1
MSGRLLRLLLSLLAHLQRKRELLVLLIHGRRGGGGGRWWSDDGLRQSPTGGPPPPSPGSCRGRDESCEQRLCSASGDFLGPP